MHDIDKNNRWVVCLSMLAVTLPAMSSAATESPSAVASETVVGASGQY